MKKTNLFSVAAALIAGAAAITTARAPAAAAPSCGDRAQLLYPYDKRARKAYRQACKNRRSAWKGGRKAWKRVRKRDVWIGY